MFLPVPHLLFLGPTAIAASLGCRRFLKKDRRNFLKRPWNPAQLHFTVFGDSGATVCYQKWEKKQCFNWGCPSNLGVPSCSSLTDLNHIPVFFSWSLISTHHPITTNIGLTFQHSNRFGVIVPSLRLKEHEHNDTVYIVVWEWVELSYVDIFASRGFQQFFFTKKRLDKRRKDGKWCMNCVFTNWPGLASTVAGHQHWAWIANPFRWCHPYLWSAVFFVWGAVHPYHPSCSWGFFEAFNAIYRGWFGLTQLRKGLEVRFWGFGTVSNVRFHEMGCGKSNNGSDEPGSLAM